MGEAKKEENIDSLIEGIQKHLTDTLEMSLSEMSPEEINTAMKNYPEFNQFQNEIDSVGKNIIGELGFNEYENVILQTFKDINLPIVIKNYKKEKENFSTYINQCFTNACLGYLIEDIQTHLINTSGNQLKNINKKIVNKKDELKKTRDKEEKKKRSEELKKIRDVKLLLINTAIGNYPKFNQLTKAVFNRRLPHEEIKSIGEKILLKKLNLNYYDINEVLGDFCLEKLPLIIEGYDKSKGNFIEYTTTVLVRVGITHIKRTRNRTKKIRNKFEDILIKILGDKEYEEDIETTNTESNTVYTPGSSEDASEDDSSKEIINKVCLESLLKIIFGFLDTRRNDTSIQNKLVFLHIKIFDDDKETFEDRSILLENLKGKKLLLVAKLMESAITKALSKEKTKYLDITIAPIINTCMADPKLQCLEHQSHKTVVLVNCSEVTSCNNDIFLENINITGNTQIMRQRVQHLLETYKLYLFNNRDKLEKEYINGIDNEINRSIA